MHQAEVWFSRVEGAVEIALSIGGNVVARSSSPESIIRELQLHGVSQLAIENRWSTELPTSARTLKLAADIGFSEPMSALKLIAACSAIDDVASHPARVRPVANTSSGYSRQARRRLR